MLPLAGQSKHSGTSEYEPLIDHLSSASPTNGRGSTDLSSKHKLKPAAFWLLMLALAASSIAIYALARTSEHPSDFASNVKWVQMEATHSGHVPASWKEREECGSEETFTLTLALKQDKMDELHEHVMAVSDPRNTGTFRQYWTAQKVREYFAPAEESVRAVTSWLEAQGFSVENGRMRLRNEQASVLFVDVSCREANELLNAKFMFYEHVETGQSHLRVADGVYNVPAEVLEHIDFVHPSVRFPLRHHTRRMEQISAEEIASMAEGDLDQYNTPDRLYSLYGMTSTLDTLYTNEGVLSSNANGEVRQAIASYLTQYYKDSDLQMAWDNLGYVGSNDLEQMQRVPEQQPQGTGSEAELDTQYITATAPGLDTFVFYVDNDEDPFVTLIEDILDATVPPMVVSISYGGDEYDMGPQYTARCNQEFGKLALLGTTVLASSGDSGVRGDDNDCYEETEYIASFPASAVYVTAVGGVEGGDLSAADTFTGETAWEFSGGGFSIYFDEPEWQSDAVAAYFAQEAVPQPAEGRYIAGKRGYPDISAQSVDYVIAVNGDWYLVSGTSASCPAIAGMVSMANVARVAQGKAALGFLNPSLYQIYDAQSDYNEVFNDITEGYNEGCRVDDDVGFYTATGWDPVTGPGSPKFEQLYRRLVDQD